MSKVYCEICKEYVDYSCEVVKLFEKVNDVPITYRYIVTRCIKCNNDVLVEAIARENGQVKREAYYKKKFE